MVIIYKFYFHYLRDQKNLNFGNNNFIRRRSFAFKSKSVNNEHVTIENYFSNLLYFIYSNLKTTKDNVILEIDNLSELFAEQEGKIRHESTFIKNKINQDVAELVLAVDDQDRQMSDLHKALKKQSKQISVV